MILRKISLSDFQGLGEVDPSKLADQKLLALDYLLHRVAKQRRNGDEVMLDDKPWSAENINNLHASVAKEMAARGFTHAIFDDNIQASAAKDTDFANTTRDGSGDAVNETVDAAQIAERAARAARMAQDANSPENQIDTANTTGKTKSVLNGIVIQAEESKISGIYKFTCGLDFQNMKVQRETIRSVKGKLYHEIGVALSTDLDADEGDVVQVEFSGLNVTKNLADGAIAVTLQSARVIGMARNNNPMSIGEAAKAARAGNAIRSREITKVDPEPDVEKGIRQAFGSYGGKRFLAHRIASYVPHHRTYVEPFTGGGAVFFAKDPSPKEVLNDRDNEIAFMYRFIQDHTLEDRKALEKRDWTVNKDTHERLKKMKPASDRDRFYKSYYLTRSSYGKMRGGSFNPANAGAKIDFPANIERVQKRLQNVKIHNKDYLDILKKYDSPNTFFYMDPPYPGKFNLFELGFKEESFLKALKCLKANWIVSYPSERAKVFKGYKVYTVKRRNQMKGPGGNKEWVTEIMVSKFPLKPLHLYIEKSLEFMNGQAETDARKAGINFLDS